MTSVLVPIRFDAPLVNPAPGGLYAATVWSDSGEGDPLRWLPSGVEVRPHNYGGEDAFGVWAAAWNAAEADLTEDDVKTGVRPLIPDPFVGMTVWASDEGKFHCEDPVVARVRAEQNLRLLEPVAVEAQFAARLLADAPSPAAAADLVDALGLLESAFATTNTLGFIHASPKWLPRACAAQLIVRSGVALKTPGGHSWIFGGGYVAGLGDTLVATSQPFGWRGPVAVKDAARLEHNKFAAVAERSVLVGYEALVGAAAIS
ncbi:hypothetical protein ORI20_27655 [Mycobacterium sp. CVI_P3]|uniref:Gp13 protein n=1 Tax=Mycobacterium pinniadriaticum TaxID=2994102 RepID=A0ABT3SLQ4_9MYCO|nr:hypothetical protein [Mycobacterium pinniadriaticum]MCX2934049.1 hypothetical protein [Mycobacterium pinniadriaticum]MCX2940454.1 hypothetical protein [Mycobacterium pinniadriaticum]